MAFRFLTKIAISRNSRQPNKSQGNIIFTLEATFFDKIRFVIVDLHTVSMTHKISSLFGALLLVMTLNGQVVINEFMATNLCSEHNPNTYLDDYGRCTDWLELLNTGPNAVDLSGWYLTDRITNLAKWPFPAGTTIAPNGFLRVWLSGSPYANDPVNYNHLHTSFRLAQVDDNEVIALVEPDGATIADVYMIEVPNQLGYSTGRFPDGADEWRVFTQPTIAAPNTSVPYLGYTPTPEFDVPAGYHTGPVELSITCADPSAQIRYTLDGTFPTEASPLYTAPISINQTTAVMARAFSTNPEVLPSYYEWSTYFFGQDQHTVPVFTVTGTQLPTLLGGQQIEPLTALEMFDVNGQRVSKSFGDTNKHGNDSWAYAQRGIDWIDRDKMGYSRSTELPIFRIKDRDDFKRYMFKAAANDNYPFQNGGAHIRDSYVQSLSQVGNLVLDERTHESCILYVNGAYWGVYDVREKYDDWRFTDYYYNQGRDDIDFLKTWGGTWAEYGNANDWNALRNFVQSNDMTDPGNYNYVTTQLEVISMMDYFIINTWIVAADWLNWNTAWWKGNHPDGTARKWRYTLWDMDASFGHYINYTGIPNTGPNADPCFAESLNNPGGQGHTTIWNALLENDEFRNLYINRYADLLNTVFSCDFALGHLDSLITIIEPEMPRQIERWGGSIPGWEANVNALRNFISQRCSDGVVDLMEDCYDLEAITLTILIEGDGSVNVNTVTITADMTPWTGTYYVGIPITLEGVPGAGVEFINWELIDGVVTINDEGNPVLTFSPEGDVTLLANFDPPIPPSQIVFNVEPEGAGAIMANGDVLNPIPANFLLDFGTEVIMEAAPNQWWEFSHWTTANGTPLNELPEEAINGFTVDQSDTFIAHFTPIIRHEVVVRVEPAESGLVQRNQTVLVPLPWSGLLVEDELFTFRATPNAFWFFDRWESTSHALPAGGQERVFDLSFQAPDTLIAYFVQEPFNVYIPNSFTPNNDGRNDVFKPVGSAWQPGSYKLMIFNRWGEVVFESDDPDQPWDGSHQGGAYYVKDDIYLYKMNVQSAHDIEPREYSGSIMVFR
jgi:gliding motility-associated-like protein